MQRENVDETVQELLRQTGGCCFSETWSESRLGWRGQALTSRAKAPDSDELTRSSVLSFFSWEYSMVKSLTFSHFLSPTGVPFRPVTQEEDKTVVWMMKSGQDRWKWVKQNWGGSESSH